MKATQRQREIIEYLCRVRNTTAAQLAREFGVSYSTITRDIVELSLSYPIYTVCGGNGGGIYISKDYFLGKKYLTSEQEALLTKLQSNVSQEEKEILMSIIKTFSKK